MLTVGSASGRLVPRGLSWEVCDVDGTPDASWLAQALRRAAAGGALDLRVAAAPGSEPWTGLGFSPLGPGIAELVLPVTQVLEGVEQTRALGERLAAALRPGDLLVLSGPLGAGKTALTQGLGAGLGVRGAVTSPTFVLARTHRGPLPLVHVDAYRLRDGGTAARADAAADAGADMGADVLLDLDLEDALEDSVVVVEWGEGLVEHLADSWLEIALDRSENGMDLGTGQGRTLRARAHGPRWMAVQPH